MAARVIAGVAKVALIGGVVWGLFGVPDERLSAGEWTSVLIGSKIVAAVSALGLCALLKAEEMYSDN